MLHGADTANNLLLSWTKLLPHTKVTLKLLSQSLMLQQMISQVILSISRDTPLYISSQQAGKSLNTRRTGLRKPSLLSSRRIGTRLRSKLKSKKNLQDQKMSSKYAMAAVYYTTM
uniref:Uncharacterized protein n=1 Tax=Cannabis sativa TaxID=3483 RepID=A0A803QTX4_CANSA